MRKYKNYSLKSPLPYLAVLLFLLTCAAGLAQQSPPAAAEPAPQTIVADAACDLIFQGKFDAAGDLLSRTGRQADQDGRCLSKISAVVEQYQQLASRRQAAKKAACQKQLEKLERLKLGKDINDVNDINDPNAPLSTRAMVILARAWEFADSNGHKQLLEDPFVKKNLDDAKAKAVEYEAQGKWLDAYTSCYYWLTEHFFPDNRSYRDYADRLIDKANIVASFQDSPCETSAQRYDGVRKHMFIRAIDALNYSYVGIVDYTQMAVKALGRCQLLAEVVSKSYDQIVKASAEPTPDANAQPKKTPVVTLALVRPDSNKLAAWSAGLSALLDEVNQSPAGITKDKFIDIYGKVLELNETTIQLPQGLLIAQFVEASLYALDPYTVIVWPQQVEDFEKIMTNEFTGIGIEISREKGLLTVASLLPDTPAYNIGLDAGDVIEAVDGTPTKDMSLTCAVRKITGPSGTKVTLTIRSPGRPTARDITITRAKITVPTIRGWQRTEAGKWRYMLDEPNRIGYVRLTGFSAETATDLEKALRQLESEALAGLILDLRGNSGGLLDSAVAVTDKFIEQGLVVSTRSRFGVLTYATAQKEDTHPNYPLVILIDPFSASASEIVAGALADPAHNRAVLVGERTHGKGSVQGITQHPGGGAQLKYTMAYYHLPSGQRVENQETVKKYGRKDWGIAPNIEVKLTTEELRKIAEVQRDNNILVGLGHDNGAKPVVKHSASETIASDPQLAAAILAVKTKIIQNNCKTPKL